MNIYNRRLAFSQIKEAARVGPLIQMPVNEIAMLTDYVDPEERAVACPNQDVVYGLGSLALDLSPVITSTTMFWRIQQSFRTRDLSFAHPRVGTVSIRAEEILVDERLEQSSTDRGFDAAQPLHLHRSEAQTGHFEVFSPQPLKRSMIDYAIVGLWASHS